MHFPPVHEGSKCGRYGWHGLGLEVLLQIARGLAYLHYRRVRAFMRNHASREGKNIFCATNNVKARCPFAVKCEPLAMHGLLTL